MAREKGGQANTITTHTHIFYSQCRLLADSQTQCPLEKSKQAGREKHTMLFCSPSVLLYKSFGCLSNILQFNSMAIRKSDI